VRMHRMYVLYSIYECKLDETIRHVTIQNASAFKYEHRYALIDLYVNRVS